MPIARSATPDCDPTCCWWRADSASTPPRRTRNSWPTSERLPREAARSGPSAAAHSCSPRRACSIGDSVRGRLAAIDPNGDVEPLSPAASGAIDALARDGNAIFAGGSFTAVNGQPRERVAAIGTGGAVTGWSPAVNRTVRAVAPAPDGTLHLDGDFSTIGGASRNRLAAIAPTGTPTPWNLDANGAVHTLALGDAVYAGGAFAQGGGRAGSRLVAIDIATAAPTGWAPAANSTVFGLALDDDGAVHAGGSSHPSTGSPAPGWRRSDLTANSRDGTPRWTEPSWR